MKLYVELRHTAHRLVYTPLLHSAQLGSVQVHGVLVPTMSPAEQASGVYVMQLAPLADSNPALHVHDTAVEFTCVHNELLPQLPLLTVHMGTGVVVVVVVVVDVTSTHLRPK